MPEGGSPWIGSVDVSADRTGSGTDVAAGGAGSAVVAAAPAAGRVVDAATRPSVWASGSARAAPAGVSNAQASNVAMATRNPVVCTTPPIGHYQ